MREGPKRGWATPTYDEILEKKRQEEKAYRSVPSIVYLVSTGTLLIYNSCTEYLIVIPHNILTLFFDSVFHIGSEY